MSFEQELFYLGKPPKQIFGKSWDFGPTGLTPPLPERGFFGNLRHKRVKYAIKTVLYKSWDWVRPPPPWDKIPTFTENLFCMLPLLISTN